MIVKKPFNTRLGKYNVGDLIADADLSPHTIESLSAGGFIAVPATKKGSAPLISKENSND